MDSASEIASVSFVGAACTLRRFGASRFCSVRDARGALAGESGIGRGEGKAKQGVSLPSDELRAALAGESGIGRGEGMRKAKQGVCPSDELRALSIGPMGGSMFPRIPTVLCCLQLVLAVYFNTVFFVFGSSRPSAVLWAQASGPQGSGSSSGFRETKKS
jgi:hypothetical protein